MRQGVSAVLGLLACVFVGTSTASVYKCSSGRGAVIYQGTACASGHELRDFDADPPTLSVVPGVPQAALAAKRTAEITPAERALRRAPKTAAVKLAHGDAAMRRFIRPDMSAAEVVVKIGRPDMTSGGKSGKRGKAVKHWIYLPAPADPSTITTVSLAEGRVVDVERKVSR